MIMKFDQIAHDPVLDRVAEIFSTRKNISASEWGPRERFLKRGTTPSPGRWSNDYVPWIVPMMDAFFEDPGKRGMITMKYGQACVSEIHITMMGYLFDYHGGPTLYMCSKKEQARKFGLERVDPMIEGSTALSDIFRTGKANNETMFYKESSSGPLILSGAGSSNDYISNPFRWIFVDELDDIGEIPGHGDPFEVLQIRMGEYETRVRCGIFGWAHPTTPDRGIARLYSEKSDQREWSIECPKCRESFVPEWDHVQIEDHDPETAVYHCPHCAVKITDAQHWKASRAGRFVSQLPPEEAKRRQFIGFHISKLCHPRVPLVDIAQQYCSCITEAQLRVFFNKVMGRPYTASSIVLTEEMVRSAMDDRHIDRSCPSDTAFITAGVDVQKPAHNPTLYFTVLAWTRRGIAVMLEYGRVQGWTALHVLLSEFTSRLSEGEGELKISACAIDHGWLTSHVYDFCRQQHAGVPCIPYKHTPRVKETQPTLRRDVTDPLRPKLGKLPTIQTCRTYWMDRALQRFTQRSENDPGGIVLPANVNREFINHILANKRFEGEDEHGHPTASYIKEDGRRDDWLQCLVGAEVVAVAKGLDKIHETIGRPTSKEQDQLVDGYVVEKASLTRQKESKHYRGRTLRRDRRLW